MRIRTVRFMLLLLITLLFSGCYIIKQGQGQLDLRFDQIPLSKAILREQNPKIQKLLLSVTEIREFAQNQLALKMGENYTGYYSTEQDGITFVVTASPKNRLESYKWWFPIVGTVTYKGFFRKKDALELEAELKKKGLDTWTFSSPAYSTLGWFKDPITTPMLRGGLPALADSIIHEMTHATWYFKGQTRFNEQLASFVGQKGALLFLQKKKEFKKKDLQKLQAAKKKGRAYSQLVNSYYKKLKFLYDQNLPLEEVISKREVIFQALVKDLGGLYPQKAKQSWIFNNARMMQFQRYNQESPLMKVLWQKSGQDWTQFWKLVEEYSKTLEK